MAVGRERFFYSLNVDVQPPPQAVGWNSGLGSSRASPFPDGADNGANTKPNSNNTRANKHRQCWVDGAQCRRGSEAKNQTSYCTNCKPRLRHKQIEHGFQLPNVMQTSKLMDVPEACVIFQQTQQRLLY